MLESNGGRGRNRTFNLSVKSLTGRISFDFDTLTICSSYLDATLAIRDNDFRWLKWRLPRQSASPRRSFSILNPAVSMQRGLLMN